MEATHISQDAARFEWVETLMQATVDQREPQ